MNHIVISPHLDDAVLSLGQFMATEPVIVVTVLAGLPERGVVSAYDESCGFETSVAAMERRRAEDEGACFSLDALPVHLDFLDRQYQVPRDRAAITAKLAEYMDRGAHVWAPLGIGHPDHRLVADCARAAVPDLGEIILYEELPYKVIWPEQVYPALERVKAEGFTVAPYAVARGSREAKAKALRAYCSQFSETDEPELYVPERAWRATL